MKPRNFFSKTAFGVLTVLCIAAAASQAYAELRIDSVYPTMGIKGQDLPITIKGSGFDANTRVSMYLDTGNKKDIISVGYLNTVDTIEIAGNLAYISSYNLLQIIDISNLSQPITIGSVNIERAISICLSGNYIYTTSIYDSLQVIDISNPSQPIIVGSINIPSPWYVAISGNYAYVTTNYGLQIIDINNPLIPINIGILNINSQSRIAINDNYLYTKDDSTVKFFDISNHSKPFLISSIYFRSGVRCVSISGGYLYVVSGDNMLNVIAIYNPSMPMIISSIDISVVGYNSVIIDNYLYISGEGFLQIIDISNPLQLFTIGLIDIEGCSGNIEFNNKYLYIACWWGGLKAIYISNISSIPQYISLINTPGNAASIDIYKNYAYIADLNNLQIIDISNPSKSMIMADYGKYSFNVSILDNYLYMYGLGLSVIDISNPIQPHAVYNKYLLNNGEYFSSDNFFIINNYIYSVDDDSGLQIIDITNPLQPIFIGYVDLPGYPKCIAISGNYAYVVADYIHDDYVSGIDSGAPSQNEWVTIYYLFFGM